MLLVMVVKEQVDRLSLIEAEKQVLLENQIELRVLLRLSIHCQVLHVNHGTDLHVISELQLIGYAAYVSLDAIWTRLSSMQLLLTFLEGISQVELFHDHISFSKLLVPAMYICSSFIIFIT